MKLINTLKLALNYIKTGMSIKEPVYMAGDARFVCSDTKNGTTIESSIVAEHAASETDEPKFCITRRVYKDGQLSTHFKKVVNLNTDDYPIKGSKNLLTSGTLYNVISDLLMLIEELQEKINK